MCQKTSQLVFGQRALNTSECVFVLAQPKNHKFHFVKSAFSAPAVFWKIFEIKNIFQPKINLIHMKCPIVV